VQTEPVGSSWIDSTFPSPLLAIVVNSNSRLLATIQAE